MRYNASNSAADDFGGRLPIKTIYGNVAMLKYFCTICRAYAFVIDNEFQCCGRIVSPGSSSCRLKRESEGSLHRKQPAMKIKRAVLEFQNHQCLYCGKSLRGRTPIEWDHFTCWKYSHNNSDHNFVAACRDCNRIKSAVIFQTVLEARIYILNMRTSKGLPNYDYYGGTYDVV